jgi:hypothetical protein
MFPSGFRHLNRRALRFIDRGDFLLMKKCLHSTQSRHWRDPLIECPRGSAKRKASETYPGRF